MRIDPTPAETIEGTAADLRAGRRTAAEVLEGCIARIEALEGDLLAWAHLDLAGARAAAGSLDRERAAGLVRGPLHGVPIGVKDLVDVRGMPTAAGFEPWSGRVADRDAPLVAGLRAAGAVILGKTVTTQFAWIDPAPTRNPWHPDRTPGGSSSGSAAAVAAGMCLGAVGSQTGGSILRPASFCGVCGLKPAFDAVSREGVVAFSRSLDHVGPIARTVADLALMLGPMSKSGPGPAPAVPDRPPTLGRLRGPFEERADPDMRSAFDRAVDALREAGATVVEVELPGPFADVHRRARTIMSCEAAVERREAWATHRETFRPRIRELVEEGLATPAVEYVLALRHQAELRRAMRAVADGSVGALLCPATIGPAPDRTTTGDPLFNTPWSYTGAAALSFPIGLGREGLPLAIQMVQHGEGPGSDLLPTALWCEAALRAGREGSAADDRA